MKRRDVIKSLTLLPITGGVFPLNLLSAVPTAGATPPSVTLQNKPMPALHLRRPSKKMQLSLARRARLARTSDWRRSRGRNQPIAVAVYRLKVLWRVRVAFDLSSQPSDRDVDRPAEGHIAVSPQLLQ